MKVFVINPVTKYAALQEFGSFNQALRHVGLSISEVQYCTLNPWAGIAVHQHGFYAPPEQQHLFSIKRHLFAGEAVMYGKDAHGEVGSIVASPPDVRFYDDYKQAVQAIEDGDIDQPSVKIGSDVIWVWPSPMPGSEEEVK